MPGVPRVLRGAVGLGLGGREDAEFGKVGLADRDETGVAEPLGQVAVERRAEVDLLQELRAEVERLAGERCAEILEQERDALERAVRDLPPGSLAPILEELVNDGVELWVQLLDVGDGRLDQL